MKKLVLCFLLLGGCRPEVDDRNSLVDAPRVLAVRATPADAKPGEAITLEALVAGESGTVVDAPLGWSRCLDRKPLAESGTVARSCLDGTNVAPFGVGTKATVTIPSDACRLFGPDRPEPKPGEPAGRAADPDATGGYYQPLRLALGSAVTIVDARIRCGLAGATQEQQAAFTATSTPNTNPTVLALDVLDASGTASPLEGAPIVPGTKLDLRVRFAPAERYPWFDPITRTLGSRREQIRVSWYATAGTFENQRTDRAADDLESDSANTWTTPEGAGEVVLWVVVRDDRGGVDFRSARVSVR